jgi:hypothetical protein
VHGLVTVKRREQQPGGGEQAERQQPERVEKPEA